MEAYTPLAYWCASGAFKSPATQPAGKSRPDQSSLLNAAKNEGCRDEAKGEVGPQLKRIVKARLVKPIHQKGVLKIFSCFPFFREQSYIYLLLQHFEIDLIIIGQSGLSIYDAGDSTCNHIGNGEVI